MKPSASFLTLFLLAALLTFCSPMENPTLSPREDKSFRITAYATESILADLIPYGKLTHINYSFLIPNADGTFAPLNNAAKLETIVESAHSQNVRVSVAVGGWGWDNEFEQMASNPESRTSFVKNLKDVVDQYQLDGVDIDWEYPDPGGSAKNYLALMEELRTALPDKLISTAVIGSWDEIGAAIPVEVFALVDYVNVMTYDGPDHGSMAEFENGINYWSERGVPKEKMNIGAPFYSRPSDIGFAELVQFDPAAAQVDSFEYNGTLQNYNGIPTIQAKTRFAMEKTGGIMFWALDHDAQGEFSLVDAIYRIVHK
jgi:GH18 family chitinase